MSEPAGGSLADGPLADGPLNGRFCADVTTGAGDQVTGAERHAAAFVSRGVLFDLEALAADCAADGRYEFLLVAGGLPVTGGVGAPVNRVAIK